MRKAIARFALAIILGPFLTATIATAQLFGISDNDPRWGSWQNAPNFPGIMIRVACGTYDPSSGDSQWSFQFQNNYPKKVYLVYQEEAGDSTGHPPTFDSPGGRNLESGEKSEMYTDYLHGTCDARKQIFIKVNSISDDDGTQTDAKPDASQTNGFAGSPQADSKPASASAVSGTSKKGSVSGASTATGGSANSMAASSNSITGTWTCRFARNFPDGSKTEGDTARITFKPDSLWYFDAGPDPSIRRFWSQDGSQIVLHDSDREGYGWYTPYSGQLRDSSHLLVTSEGKAPKEIDSLDCTR